MKRYAVIFIILLFLLLTACNDGNAELTDADTVETPEESQMLNTEDTEEQEPESETEPEDEWWMEDNEDNKDNEENIEEVPEKTANNESAANAAAKEPAKYYSYLTGYQITRAQQRKRPVSVIMNNISVAMPMVGISSADIIYECTVEGGITRLMMILADYDKVPVFGSVRSSREYFIDLSRAHDTIYVHAGGNPQDYTEFYNRKIDRLDGVNKVDRSDGASLHFTGFFYRDSERRKTMSLEHTLMITGENILEGIKYAKYRTRHNADYTGTFNFNTEFQELPGNNTANYVSVPYSQGFQPEFIYNPDDKLYYRKQYGKPHIDGATGEQIKFENVIVLFAEYTQYRENEIARREGHLACKLTGTGYGFYINGGKYTTIKWQKDTRDSVFSLSNLDDSDLYLNPGKSFICVTSKTYDKSVVINSDLKNIG